MDDSKLILEVLQTSPVLGVILFAVVWVARKDVGAWARAVGVYADEYMKVQRSIVDVQRENASATRELGEAIASGMDRFENVATSSLARLSSELTTFRRDVAPMLRALSVGDKRSKDVSKGGDVLLISSSPDVAVDKILPKLAPLQRLHVASSFDSCRRVLESRVDGLACVVVGGDATEELIELVRIAWSGPILGDGLEDARALLVDGSVDSERARALLQGEEREHARIIHHKESSESNGYDRSSVHVHMR